MKKLLIALMAISFASVAAPSFAAEKHPAKPAAAKKVKKEVKHHKKVGDDTVVPTKKK